jgi:hypothetical protein
MSAYDFVKIKKQVNATGKLAFDIETTGKTEHDKIVAVGYAWKKRDGTVVNGHVAMRIMGVREREHLERGMLSWMDIWRRHNYEMRCFTEFWNPKGKPSLLPILEELQFGEKVVDDEYSLALLVNEVIKKAEQHWDGSIQIITDTTAFDTCWLHRLLVSHGLQPLDTTRTGNHRWTYEVDSFALGVAGKTPDTVNWLRLESFKNLLEQLPIDDADHDHHPANDAKFILARFEALEMYQAMAPTSEVDIIFASSEECDMMFDEHVRQIRERIGFFRSLLE